METDFRKAPSPAAAHPFERPCPVCGAPLRAVDATPNPLSTATRVLVCLYCTHSEAPRPVPVVRPR